LKRRDFLCLIAVIALEITHFPELQALYFQQYTAKDRCF